MTIDDLNELDKRMDEGDLYDANEFLGILEKMIPQMRSMITEIDWLKARRADDARLIYSMAQRTADRSDENEVE